MGVRQEWVGRRQAVRQTCHMRAEMRFIDGRKPIDCTVTDISATGARLELPEGFDCPEDFDLYIPSRDETKHAKVRRITDEGVGIAFLKSRHEDPLVVQSMIERLTRLELALGDVKSFAPPQGRDAPQEAHASAAFEARLDQLSKDLADLRGLFETRIAAPVLEPVDHEPQIASLRADMSALGAKMREEIRQVSDAAASELAEDIAKDFGGIRVEMGRLDTSVRALTEMASVNAALTPNDHGPEIISLRGEVAALAQAVRDATDGSAVPAPAEDLSDIRAEMEKLGVSMRGQAHIPQPETFRFVEPEPVVASLASAVTPSAGDVAELKAEIADLRAMVVKMSSAATGAPSPENPDLLRGEVEELRQSVRALILVVAKSLNAPRQAA